MRNTLARQKAATSLGLVYWSPAQELVNARTAQIGECMRRVVAVASVLMLSLVLGCSPDAPAKAPDLPTSSTKREISVESSVTLRNGLTLTVPAGWTATLTTYSSPDGPLKASEYLLLENFDADEGPRTLMVFSSSATKLPLSAVNSIGHDTFDSVGQVDGVDLFMGQFAKPYRPKRLMSAQTKVPGSALGVLYFAGEFGDPEGSLRGILELFEVDGI